MNEHNKAFLEWLSGTDGSAFPCKADSYHITLIRVQKNADFDYLYCQRQYKGAGIERGDNFEYAGIYCKHGGLVYDGQYVIRDLAPEPGEFETRSAEALTKILKADVCRTVEDVVGNDRNNLCITEISDARRLEQLSSFPKYAAAGMARNHYLYSEFEDYGFLYKCHYSPDTWTEDSLLAYILDPAGYAAAEAAAYIDSHQEDMLAAFLEGDMITAEYAAIRANPLNPVLRVKRIMAAVSASSAKTVTVTICKDDMDFSFKAEADQFRRDCSSHYSDWNIVAADRREFARLFGRSAQYGPEDILRIEYARAVLYQAEEVPV